jgi:hypothetical protein
MGLSRFKPLEPPVKSDQVVTDRVERVGEIVDVVRDGLVFLGRFHRCDDSGLGGSADLCAGDPPLRGDQQTAAGIRLEQL